MYIADTSVDSEGRGWLDVRKVDDFRTLLCHLVEDWYCQHEDGKRYRCIVDPPRWTWAIGGHYRFSLGGLLCTIGQRISARTGCAPVFRLPVTELELRGIFDWPPHAFEHDEE